MESSLPTPGTGHLSFSLFFTASPNGSLIFNERPLASQATVHDMLHRDRPEIGIGCFVLPWESGAEGSLNPVVNVRMGAYSYVKILLISLASLHDEKSRVMGVCTPEV
ncbi:hypothetical protein NUU61_009752 [Penicillium alfredii]|uniref:Uncharacterized protein n=1 Tax=Penicillium alfredii TaxID=1506179 RepID=A0A9W9EGP2_9EURO|nr:uncharacterized protein NUU61_009752 [Penicillium alfredii]KAJ5081488.1 hypothetical protein NUU61_009752 [Penicillium alfredii]